MSRKKVIIFNDYCGIGNVALKMNTFALMANGIEVIGVPTKLFSSPMNNPAYVELSINRFDDFVNSIALINDHYDGVLVGLLGDEQVFNGTLEFIKKYGKGKMILDPILGDNGAKYSGTKDVHIQFYREIIKYSKLVIPNITEAILLSGGNLENYKHYDDTVIEKLIDGLVKLGANRILLKGENENGEFVNRYFDGREIHKISSKFVLKKFHGTGDLIAGLLTAISVKDELTKDNIKKAQDMISGIIESAAIDEEILPDCTDLRL